MELPSPESPPPASKGCLRVDLSIPLKLQGHDNGSDHRAGTIILQAEKSARKPGFACITLLSTVFRGMFMPIEKSRVSTIVVLAVVIENRFVVIHKRTVSDSSQFVLYGNADVRPHEPENVRNVVRSEDVSVSCNPKYTVLLLRERDSNKSGLEQRLPFFGTVTKRRNMLKLNVTCRALDTL